MASVTVKLPGLLAASAGGQTTLTVEGDTVCGVLEALMAQWPAMRIHLFDQQGAQREHVLMLYNDENLRWFDPGARPAAEGDVLTVLQLVSGG
ncbi:MAG: MoaD/ThiS family protein [Candidatus Hydrogenedentes bacterium]|nr:MoaD/ThiS family protein [Candidatus Hydrogenedentota bacterium]